jgi:uncharacterized protein with HEPN domain
MNRDEGLLRHISIYIADVESFTAGFTYERFLSDRKTMQAVCYAILNIGELSKELSEELRQRNLNIPWKQIKGMRDRAAHGYHLMAPDIIWDVVNIDLPEIKNVVTLELQNFSSGAEKQR